MFSKMATQLNIETKLNDLINIHPVSGKANDSFVGFKLNGGYIDFYYPESFDLDKNSEDFKSDLISIIKSISLAKSYSKQNSTQYKDKVNDLNSYSYLASQLWIIRDYVNNGVYINTEKAYRSSLEGRVNWKRTMKMTPYVSNGNIVFKDVVSEIQSHQENILVEAHKYCINKSINSIGWLFGYFKVPFKLPRFNEQIKQRYIQAINKEIKNTFNDQKQMLLAKMLDVISGLNSIDYLDKYSYGVDKYHYVFERMVDHVFGNVKDLSKFFPKGQWGLLKNDGKEFDSSNLRPDTIIVKEDNAEKMAFILDSKYYRFGYTSDDNDLPETTSIQKQITYGDYIKRNVTLGSDGKSENFSHVYNAFLLPYNKNKNGVFKSNKDIQYIGYAKSTWKDNTQGHEFIYTFLIDLKHLVKMWDKGNNETDVNYLIDEIMKVSKKGTFSQTR